MTPRTMAQLAYLYSAEVEALLEPYAWPPKAPSAAQATEASRLSALADEAWKQAGALGFVGGADAAFG